VVVAAVLVALAGCSGSDARGGGAPEEVSGSPALPADEPLKVLRGWVERHNKAITSGDERLWREAVTGALALPVQARVRTYGKLAASAQISLANPVFYVPRSGSPRWFSVAALERAGRTEQQVLGVFVRSGGVWRAAHWLTFKGEPPRIAFDPEGYAIAVDDRGLPGAHAGYLARGDETGVMPDAYSRNARTKAVGDWDGAPGTFTPGPGPSYALRTQDGGALVWYAVRQEQVLKGGTAAGLPVEARDHLDGRPGKTVTLTWQWLAIGYAPRSGKARVLGESVSLVSAR
jgi:hypothetical protein